MKVMIIIPCFNPNKLWKNKSSISASTLYTNIAMNYLFLLLLGVFFLFYVIFGNRLGIFQEILKILLPFSIFGILFLVVLRVRIINIKKYKKENIDEETIVYLTRQDRHKDLLVRLGLPVIILFIAALDGLYCKIRCDQKAEYKWCFGQHSASLMSLRS